MPIPASNDLKTISGRDEGAVAIYVAMLATLLVGMGVLAVDVARYVSLNTELQSAADAAALAGAQQLDRFPGARAQAREAAAQAVANAQLFAEGGPGDVVLSTQDCDDAGLAPGASCIRFLKSLPANDSDPITATNIAASDEEARFVEVRVGATNMDAIFAAALATTTTVSTAATAVAGNDQVVCSVPPMFMCNPVEPAGNTDPSLGLSPSDLADLEGHQIKSFLQGSGGGYTPGNFGLLCPTGTEGQSNCGGDSVKEALASVTGTCLSLEALTTKTGVTLGQVRAGINARFNYWLPQATGTNGDWRNDPNFMPAKNVTMGRYHKNPPAANQTKCEPDPVDADQGTALPRDDCHVTETCPSSPYNDRVGSGVWDYQTYFRLNHGIVDVDSNKPTGWPVDSEFWPPTRYEVYRYEIERPTTLGSMVSPGQSIPNSDGTSSGLTTQENGNANAACYAGGTVTDDYTYLDDPVRDLRLLQDRRIFPIALANCNALGNPSGKFSFKPSELVYVFLTEPMGSPSESALFIEMLGPLDEGAVDALVRDVVQLYRR